MGFTGTETQRAENAGDVRSVILFQAIAWQDSAIDQPLQPEHSDDVGLSLLQSRIQRPDGFPDIQLPPSPPCECRPKPV